MQIQFVFVRRTSASCSTFHQAALHLTEESQARACVEVRMEHVTLQEKSVAVLRTRTPGRILKSLEPPTAFSSDRDVPASPVSDWNVLQRVPSVYSLEGI